MQQKSILKEKHKKKKALAFFFDCLKQLSSEGEGQNSKPIRPKSWSKDMQGNWGYWKVVLMYSKISCMDFVDSFSTLFPKA